MIVIKFLCKCRLDWDQRWLGVATLAPLRCGGYEKY
jgi:hypothetical protein